jgi:PiT family inorganic phosphate transporter
MSVLLVVTLLLVLGAEFVNGLTDAANAIATVVGTRVLSPTKAVVMAAVFNMAGVLVTGTAVAATIGKGIVDPEIITLEVVAAAMLTIVVWSTAAWRFGIPTSETHELVAGLAGAGLASAGPSVLLWDGWRKVLIGLGMSTLIGFGLGLVIMVAIYWLFHRAPRSPTNRFFDADFLRCFYGLQPRFQRWAEVHGSFCTRTRPGWNLPSVPRAALGNAPLRFCYGPWYSSWWLAHYPHYGNKGHPT